MIFIGQRLHATQLVAFLLIFRGQVNASNFSELIENLKSRKRCLAFNTSDYAYAIRYAEEQMVSLNRSSMEYLANAVLPAFFNESVVATALASMIESPISAYVDMNAKISVKRADLVERSLDAFDLLSFDNLLGWPCKDSKDVIEEAFDLLKLREIIFVKEEQLER